MTALDIKIKGVEDPTLEHLSSGSAISWHGGQWRYHFWLNHETMRPERGKGLREAEAILTALLEGKESDDVDIDAKEESTDG